MIGSSPNTNHRDIIENMGSIPKGSKGTDMSTGNLVQHLGVGELEEAYNKGVPDFRNFSGFFLMLALKLYNFLLKAA